MLFVGLEGRSTVTPRGLWWFWEVLHWAASCNQQVTHWFWGRVCYRHLQKA